MKSFLLTSIVIIFVFIVSGCCEERELKLLNWRGNSISLTETNCGATTSFLWKIYFHKSGKKSRKLIFKSYSSPNVEMIRISGDNLFIECGEDRGNKNIIEINLMNVKDFIHNPIYYYRSYLKKTNSSFHEPEFIREERTIYIKK